MERRPNPGSAGAKRPTVALVAPVSRPLCLIGNLLVLAFSPVIGAVLGAAMGCVFWYALVMGAVDALGALFRRGPARTPTPAPADLSDQVLLKIADMVEEHARLQKLSNQELVQECPFSKAADFTIVEEMMSRLSPGWENEDTDNHGDQPEGARAPQERSPATDGTARMAGKNGTVTAALSAPAVTESGAGAVAGSASSSFKDLPRCPNCNRGIGCCGWDNDQGDFWFCTSCGHTWK